MTKQTKMTILTGAVLLAIVLLAATLRLYNIKNYPPGLYPDEAANGEDILRMFHGDVQPFYPRGNGREALFFFIQAAMIKTFGSGLAWPFHVASALVGITTVLALYYATKVWFGRLSGLLAAFFLATNHWHLTLSRTGFRAIMVPLFVALFTAWVGFTIQSVKKKQIFASYIYAALAGAAFMGGFYTYIAYRAMIGVVAGVFLLLLLAALHPKIGFPHFRRYWKQTLVAIIAALVVASPLVWYFVHHPDAIMGRAGQVSVFNVELQREFGGGTVTGTILYSTRVTLLSFFTNGDLNWRHNVSGFPLINPLVGILFLLGVAWVINGTVTVFMEIIKGREVHMGMIYPYLLLMLGGMLAPVVTTAEGLPHGLRSLGLIVPIFLLAGTAGSVSLYWLKNKVKNEGVRFAGFGIAVGLLFLNLLYGPALYFLISGNDAKAYYEYRGDLTVVSQYLNDYHKNHPDAPVPYLVLDKYSLQTVTYLTTQLNDYLKGRVIEPDDATHIWKQVDPATSYKTTIVPGEIMVFTQSTIFDAEKYAKEHPAVKTIASKQNRFGQEILRVYEIPGSQPTEGTNSLDSGI